MSIHRRLPACALLLVVALGACTTDGGSAGSGDVEGPDDGAGGGSFPSLAPEDPGETADAPTLDPRNTAGTETCALVRDGIDAFNEGDFEDTVELFAEALPLAELAVESPDATAEAVLLVEAVRYYAELAPQEYAAGAAATEEFEINKQITLGLCVTDGAPLAPPSSGGPGAPGVEA